MMKALLSSLAFAVVLLHSWSGVQAATWVTQNANAGISTNLRNLWGADANNVWATGGNSTNIPLLLKWDGTAWGPVTTTSAVPLYSVWGTSANNVWVGGRKGHLMRYDGNNWTTFTSGMETDGTNGPFFVYGIWGTDANNIWAVGGNGEFARIIKWDGNNWSSQYNSNVNGSLRNVWGTATNNVWAVGDKGLVLHYDGTGWTPVTYSVSPSVTTTTLFSIWGTDANNIWIGGGVVSSTVTLLKWDGTSISRFDMTGIPASGSVGSVRGIKGTSASNIYIVGDQGPFASRWDGSSWTTQSTGQSATSLNAVWCTADGSSIWVSGASSTISRGTAAPEAVVVAPTLASTPSGSATSYQAATLGGEVTATGGASVTTRGFVYALTSANANPQLGGSSVTNLSETGTYGTGTFSLNASGLTGGSTYSFKAYATNSSGTSYSSVGTFTTLPALVPEIAITGNSVAIVSGDVTPSAADGTDFGAVAVSGATVEHTFTITNSGTASLSVTGASVSGSSAFTISVQPGSSVADSGGTTTFKVLFDPSAEGVATAIVTVASDDADEASYTFTVTGGGLAPKTFDLAGNAIVDFPYDSGETYIYSSVQPPVPVDSNLGDVVSSGDAPGENGTDSVGEFDALRRGGFLAENGYLAFPGYLKVGTGSPAVTEASKGGLWKTSSTSLFLLARTGTTVPDVTGAQFATLPEVPGINDDGEVSFLGTLVIGTGTPAVTASDDTGLWSELGSTGLGLLIRENDGVPTSASATKVASFASGIYATAKTSASTGEAVFSVNYRGDTTKSALVRASVNATTIGLSEVARESNQAPGTAAGVVFTSLSGSYADPGRMDAQGNFVFSALTTPGNKEGIWYQPVTGGTPSKVIFSGEAAPGTTTTFSKIYRPSMGGNSYITFRAGVSATGDNATNTRNDGIWAGFANNPSSITCILRRGDGTSVVPNLPVGSLVGNVWGGWLTNSNRGAWKAWLDVDGNTTSAAPTDKHAIYSTLSGAMRLELKAGDAAPGTTGATFSTFDLPVVGGDNQYAFLGTLTGGDVVGTTNNEGVWKSTANGAALNMILRKGDTMVTTEGSKVIQKLDLPGSNGTDRRWEQPVMDATGRLVIFITFADGSTSQILAP